MKSYSRESYQEAVLSCGTFYFSLSNVVQTFEFVDKIS